MNKNSEKEIAKVLKAMAHPVRISILRKLLKGPCCATSANKAIPISQPNLSQHLRALRVAKLIHFEKKGSKRCYHLTDKLMIKRILSSIDSIFAGRK